eukprot:gene25769-34350_t
MLEKSLVYLVITVGFVRGFTPLVPTHGYTYTIEAAREQAWPSCAYRFLSYSASSNVVDLWNGAGVNQHWLFLDSGSNDGSFYLKTGTESYLSYSGDCNSKTIDLWKQAGINQKFKFVVGDNTQFEYYIEAIGRSQCSFKYMSFPVGCTTSSPDLVDLWYATGTDQRFRIYPISSLSPVVHKVGTNTVCPDPYVWKSASTGDYMIQCTGGGLKLGQSSDLEPSSSQFTYLGDCLGGTKASWAASDERWAPENFVTVDGKYNYMFFADVSDGTHRIGWARSSSGPAKEAYTQYSSSYLNLGMAPGGDIDGHVFADSSNGKTYLVWKTDDNSVGSSTTRIWVQELSFANETVSQVGSPVVIMDSTGLWWVTSWVQGGSLVEGPEVVQVNGWYYLFFAAGQYCTDFYTEGVARSKSIFGPFEKMTSPVLTNGIVGVAKSPSTGNLLQLVGPGHATIVQVPDGGWRIVWHASIGENCNRYSFITELVFGADGWPYVNLT